MELSGAPSGVSAWTTCYVLLENSFSQSLDPVLIASTDGVRQPTIVGAWRISSSFSRAATIKRAKSRRRVRLLARTGSPTWPLHTGRPWISPSYTLLPRTRVHRVLLPNTCLHASTWSSRSPTLSSHATHPTDLKVGQYRYLPSRVMCQPQENMRRAARRASSRTACAVPDEYWCTPQGTSTVNTSSHPSTAFLITGRSFLAPGKTVIRPLNPSSLPTLRFRQTPTTS